MTEHKDAQAVTGPPAWWSANPDPDHWPAPEHALPFDTICWIMTELEGLTSTTVFGNHVALPLRGVKEDAKQKRRRKYLLTLQSWAHVLRGCTQAELLRGLYKVAMRDNQFPPSAGQFNLLCRPWVTDLERADHPYRAELDYGRKRAAAKRPPSAEGLMRFGELVPEALTSVKAADEESVRQALFAAVGRDMAKHYNPPAAEPKKDAAMEGTAS